MTVSPFTRAILQMFAGPLIWSAHFLAVYVFAALACARPFGRIEWLGVGIVQWATAVMTLAAAASVAAILLAQDHESDDMGEFQRWMTVFLGALSVLGMLWVATPVYLVPDCK